MSGAAFKRAIYIAESPFSKRDELLLGVPNLRALGLDIEFWEVAPLFLPLSEGSWIQPPVGIYIHRFTSLEILMAACRELAEEDIVFVLSGVYRDQIRTHGAMIKALSQSNATLVAISQGNMPRLENRTRDRLGPGRNLRALMRIAIRVMRRSWQPPPGRSSRRGMIYQRLSGIRALDYIWAGVTVSNIDSRLMSTQTKITYIHNWDYDKILEASKIPRDESHVAIFLDHMGFSHPDARSLKISIEGYSEDKFFSRVRMALDEFEARSGLKVEIAAHPRAEPGSLDACYGGRKVRHLETAEAIAHSQVVLVTNATTAVGLAVTLNRPIVVLQSTAFHFLVLIQTGNLAGLLRLPIIDLDAENRDWSIPDIDKNAYDAYVRQYVKRPGTPEVPFWDVVARAIAANTDVT